MERKKVIVCILALVVLLFSATNVFALGGLNDLDDPMIDEDNNSNLLNELPRNQTENLTQNITINNNGTGTIKDGNAMPNTGIEDLPIIAIGICIVSAAVAYTQIRKYNV